MAPSRQYLVGRGAHVPLQHSTAAARVARAVSSSRYDVKSSLLVGLIVGGILLTIFFVSLCIRIRKIRRERAHGRLEDQNGFGNKRGCRIDSPNDEPVMAISSKNNRPAWPQQPTAWPPAISISRPPSASGSYRPSQPSPPPSYAQVTAPASGAYNNTPLPTPPPPLLLTPGNQFLSTRPLSATSEGSTRRYSLESQVSCRITDLAELPGIFVEPPTREPTPSSRSPTPKLKLAIPRTQKWVTRR